MRAPGSRDKRAIRGVMLIAVLAVALLIAACGLSGNHQAGDAGQESDEFRANADANSSRWSARSEAVATIDFRITTLEGGEFHLADKRGRVVALYFMASWCGTCIPEAQVWSELYPAYRERPGVAHGLGRPQRYTCGHRAVPASCGHRPAPVGHR